jgi:hypothetical protein
VEDHRRLSFVDPAPRSTLSTLLFCLLCVTSPRHRARLLQARRVSNAVPLPFPNPALPALPLAADETAVAIHRIA